MHTPVPVGNRRMLNMWWEIAEKYGVSQFSYNWRRRFLARKWFMAIPQMKKELVKLISLLFVRLKIDNERKTEKQLTGIRGRIIIRGNYLWQKDPRFRDIA